MPGAAFADAQPEGGRARRVGLKRFNVNVVFHTVGNCGIILQITLPFDQRIQLFPFFFAKGFRRKRICTRKLLRRNAQHLANVSALRMKHRHQRRIHARAEHTGSQRTDSNPTNGLLPTRSKTPQTNIA